MFDKKISIAILSFAGILIALRIFVFGSYIVPTQSMENTINISDCLLGNKVAYINKSPERGDIITFNQTGKNLVKRVIAVAGDTIDIRDGSVYLNGEKLEENYTVGKTEDDTGNVRYPYTLKDGELWVMGDNRENSKDSRVFGAIKTSSVESKIVFRFFPFNRLGTV